MRVLLLSGCFLARCLASAVLLLRSWLFFGLEYFGADVPTADTRSKHFMRNFHRCYAEAILTFVLVVSRYCRLLKSSASATGGDASGGQARLEAIEEEETVRMHLAALKREEVALQVGFARVLVSSSFFFFLPVEYRPSSREKRMLRRYFPSMLFIPCKTAPSTDMTFLLLRFRCTPSLSPRSRTHHTFAPDVTETVPSHQTSSRFRRRQAAAFCSAPHLFSRPVLS